MKSNSYLAKAILLLSDRTHLEHLPPTNFFPLSVINSIFAPGTFKNFRISALDLVQKGSFTSVNSAFLTCVRLDLPCF